MSMYHQERAAGAEMKRTRQKPKLKQNIDSPRTDDSPQGAAFDFAEYKRAVLADPRAREVIQDFLKYRHREWEENLAPASAATQSKKRS
jgi:hypothetical protein